MSAGPLEPDGVGRFGPGTSEDVWNAAVLAGRAAPLELDHIDRLVVLSAHPTDQTLGAGGLIRHLHGRGLPIQVIVGSNGEGSHPGSSTHDPDRLWGLQRTEVARALSRLAPSAQLRRLGLPHGSLSEHVPALTEATRAAVGTAGERALVVAVWQDDGHLDHRAVARAADSVVAATGATLIEFPIRAWHWADPEHPALHPSRLAVLPLTEGERTVKRRAIREHHSQLEPLSPAAGDRPVLEQTFLEYFDRSYETFLPAHRSLPADYFDEMYGAADDPWQLGGSWYEERKRAVTMAALPRARFRSAFEPGCALGLLTELLAPRCDRLLASDITDGPLAGVARRLASFPQVDVQRLAIPEQWPAGEFDLVVLSEIGYYCDHTDLSRVIDRMMSTLAPDGVVVACHWRYPVADYPLTGDQVQQTLVAESGLSVAVSHLEEDFRLDVLVRPGTPSVARAEGVWS